MVPGMEPGLASCRASFLLVFQARFVFLLYMLIFVPVYICIYVYVYICFVKIMNHFHMNEIVVVFLAQLTLRVQIRRLEI